MTKVILVGCSGLLLIVVVVFGYSFYRISADLKESPWCEQGFQLACTNSDVRDELGTSLKLGWIASGTQMITRGGGKESGQANISVPIKGSEGKGRLRLKAIMRDGEWLLEAAEVTISADDHSIDLLHDGKNGNGA